MNRFPRGWYLLVSIFIILVIDTGISFPAHLSPLALIAITRFVQTLVLLALIFLGSGGTRSVGLTGNNLFSGIKTGLLWSCLAGACAVGGIGLLYLAGIHLPGQIYAFPGGKNIFAYLGIACFLSPIAEELFFRGFLYSYFRKKGLFVGLAASSFLFALAHFSQGGLPLIQFAGGILFALSFEYSKSLAAPLIIHISGNLAIFAWGYFL
ncbi:MAG: CPBP family intramembrane metalloprotease [Desulfobacteraceae bacterium]|nr:CPBP family intramembrane metalloprotease [Desulfobacteraceae bacterium]